MKKIHMTPYLIFLLFSLVLARRPSFDSFFVQREKPTAVRDDIDVHDTYGRTEKIKSTGLKNNHLLYYYDRPKTANDKNHPTERDLSNSGLLTFANIQYSSPDPDLKFYNAYELTNGHRIYVSKKDNKMEDKNYPKDQLETSLSAIGLKIALSTTESRKMFVFGDLGKFVSLAVQYSPNDHVSYAQNLIKMAKTLDKKPLIEFSTKKEAELNSQSQKQSDWTDIQAKYRSTFYYLHGLHKRNLSVGTLDKTSLYYQPIEDSNLFKTQISFTEDFVNDKNSTTDQKVVDKALDNLRVRYVFQKLLADRFQNEKDLKKAISFERQTMFSTTTIKRTVDINDKDGILKDRIGCSDCGCYYGVQENNNEMIYVPHLTIEKNKIPRIAWMNEWFKANTNFYEYTGKLDGLFSAEEGGITNSEYDSCDAEIKGISHSGMQISTSKTATKKQVVLMKRPVGMTLGQFFLNELSNDESLGGTRANELEALLEKCLKPITSYLNLNFLSVIHWGDLAYLHPGNVMCYKEAVKSAGGLSSKMKGSVFGFDYYSFRYINTKNHSNAIASINQIRKFFKALFQETDKTRLKNHLRRMKELPGLK
jgi:hypothetical protein